MYIEIYIYTIKRTQTHTYIYMCMHILPKNIYIHICWLEKNIRTEGFTLVLGNFDGISHIFPLIKENLNCR